MLLEGSCHCGAVRFALHSETPVPFMRCYCSICRKTAGGGGYAINIMGLAATLKVQGEEHISTYHAVKDKQQAPNKKSQAARKFCKHCGSALWLADPRWPEGVWPFASAIDTPLPPPPAYVSMMENYRPDWANENTRMALAAPIEHFPEYPEESIADWHKHHGQTVK